MMNTEDAKQRIQELVDNYTKLVEEKRISKYNEEMTKKDFILPLFEALGWNVYNKSNKTDYVSAEETISKKRVDYGFKIHGIPKFLLEAKAIPVDLNKTKYAEQAINYSWHKGCTWAVLTDFEGIKVFNAEWRLKNVRDNLFLNLDWRDYLYHFDKLWLLSKESFEKGLLDKEAELVGKKGKKIPVDKQLLADFTRFREMLSKDITKFNQDKGLTEEELDESVQRVLDRLIFIRNCEDRELESRKLMPALRDWESQGRKGQLLKQLRAIFNYFDGQYNSKLFQEHLCDKLDISDSALNEVVDGLYQTKDKTVYYDFSAIEADVLGNIYEQYLGHILKKTAKRAKVTESHARRKEHGIYYTPPYIVDYIVRNTLGELLKRKRQNEIEKISVLDPACGSGSFLIKSFDILNEYWKEKDKDYAQAQLDTTGQGTTFTRKVKILQNNIFGVDLDKQAIEIAQLNLLLKIAEKGHRLPLLQKNIKNGNSLIDNPEVAGIKALKWEEEFKEIIKEGGFDVVIGNPPWGADISAIEKAYFGKNYSAEKQNMNSFELFLRRSIMLLKEGGVIGFLIPRNFIRSGQYSEIRRIFLENFVIHHIIDFKKFPEVTQECVTIIATKRVDWSISKKNENNIEVGEGRKMLQGVFLHLPRYVFNLKLDEKKKNILEKILGGNKLGELINVDRGEEISKKGGVIKCPYCNKWSFASKKDRKKCPSCNKEFLVVNASKDEIISKEKIELFNPILIGEDFSRYRILGCHYIDFKREGIKFKSTEIYKSPKMIMMAVSPIFITAFDERENIVLTKNNYSIKIRKEVDIDLKYLLAIFNSKLYRFYQENLYTLGAEYTIFISKEYLKSVKILNPSNFDTNQKIEYTNLIETVDKLLTLNNRLNEIGDKKTDERSRIEEEIDKTDEEIDNLVYKIYGITEEEKRVIDRSFK